MKRLFAGLLATLLSSGAPIAQEAAPAQAQSGPVLMFDGDSISAGRGASRGQTLAAQTSRLLQWPGRVVNTARSGRQMAECWALYSDTVGLVARPQGEPGYLFIHAGDNDVRAGATASATYEALSRYVARAHADGWVVIVSTELNRPRFSRKKQAELKEYNRLVVSNSARADIVIDFAAIPEFSDPDNRSNPAVFSPDAVHPSNGGYEILARATASAVEAFRRSTGR